MSDTVPKKRPQRPAAPLWAARPRTRAEEEAPPVVSPFATPTRVPRPGGPPRPAAPDAAGARESNPGEEGEHPAAAAAPSARIPAGMVASVPAKATASSAKAASDEPEAVSLREIETMLSPGKAPPRLPGSGARPAAPGAPQAGKPIGEGPAPRGPQTAPSPGATRAPESPGPARAPLDSVDEHDPVPPSSRWGESRTSDLSAMAALVPAPRAVAQRAPRPPPVEVASPGPVERPLPSAMESTAADLELMAALAPAPPKKPAPTKPAAAPPKAPLQARGAVVAVLSSEATAALKGERAPSGAGTSTGPGAWRGPGGPGTPMRSPTMRSTAVTAERPSTGDRSSVVVPPPPVRIAQARPAAEEVDDSGWDVPDETSGARAARRSTPPPPMVRRSTPPPPPVVRRSTPPPPPVARRSTPPPPMARRSTPPPPPVDAVAMDALQMRAGSRGSLPDPVELLRDSTDPTRSTGRGSVVDPLELYGAVPDKPRVPEQSLPKVMVQVPAKIAAEPKAAPRTGTAAEAEAKAAASIAEAEAKAAASIAEAEAKAAAASAEANAAFRPRVDLPARVEPKPFPKPPPRRQLPSRPDVTEAAPPEATPAARTAAITAGPGATRTPSADDTLLTGARPKPAAGAVAAGEVKPPPPPPRAAVKPALSLKALEDVEPVSAEPVSAEPDDDIPIDFTPDAPEIEASAAKAPPAPGGPPVSTPTPDSGRFDLQQLMSGGPKSGQKGLGDTDLFSLAGDLFSDTSPPNLAPPDLSALAKAGPSKPPPSSARLLAPVAVGTAPDAASAKARTAASTPAVARPVEEPRSGASRALTPWILLPVVAMAAAVVMVWRGRTEDPPKDLPVVVTAPQGQREPVPTVTAPTTSTDPASPPPSATAPADEKSAPRPSDTPPSGSAVWKPPSTSTAPAVTAPTSPPTVTTAPPTATTPPTATVAPTAPAPSGNEFNTAAAKAALRNAAGAAAGCPSDKPGVASVAITFAPSGRVTSSQVSGSFAGTTTGGCIASAMRAASVPPFDGGPVSVNWKVTIR